MKKTLFLCLLTASVSYGQIYTQSTTDGSTTITSKGLQGSGNPSTGTFNVALGSSALSANTSGYSNTAIGVGALRLNSTGYHNTANGAGALNINISGSDNTAIGYGALAFNTGEFNTADGAYALYANTIGFNNAANGTNALLNNTMGYQNTASGFNAGKVNVSGNNNTYLGSNANPSGANLNNATAIGVDAIVNASNKIRLGNAGVTSIEGQVAYSFPSDRRLKENIQYTSHLGLNFISKLQTVSYTYKSDKTHVRHDGFIAQDIEAVMKELNVDFGGLKKSADGMYSLAYSDFIMPLVNAVKEQQKEIDELKKQVQALIKAQNNKQ